VLTKVVKDVSEDPEKVKMLTKRTGGGLAAAANAALFGLPSKIKPVGKYLKKYKEENPDAAKVSETIGEFANVIPGAGAIKALSKVKKVGDLFTKGGTIKLILLPCFCFGSMLSFYKYFLYLLCFQKIFLSMLEDNSD
jgi:hypothetical protein